MREFLINRNDGGQRLDKFIMKLMPNIPKSMLYKSLRKNCVRVNGKHIKDGNIILAEGDKVTLYMKDEFYGDTTDFKYVKPKLDIVYEDNNIMVINKPVGMLCHADEHGEGETLIDMVISYLYDTGEYNPKTENTFKPALCNRLDRNTGGLVISAKNASALREMNNAIKNRNVHKYYSAVVEGYTPESGILRGHIVRDNKVTVVSDEGKEASLAYKSVEQKNGYTLLEIELHTGRTHQIRAQFADFGYPLAGDTKYGAKSDKFRQALYSTRVKFNFPKDSMLEYLNEKEIRTEAPFMKDFKE